MTGRKVIQVAMQPLTFEKAEYGEPEHGVILALCDDGTMWLRQDYWGAWREVPNVPQPAISTL